MPSRFFRSVGFILTSALVACALCGCGKANNDPNVKRGAPIGFFPKRQTN